VYLIESYSTIFPGLICISNLRWGYNRACIPLSTEDHFQNLDWVIQAQKKNKMPTLISPTSAPQHVAVVSILLWSVLGYIAWLALYRSFVSRLARAKIPGPRLAALTSWYECYYGMLHS